MKTHKTFTISMVILVAFLCLIGAYFVFQDYTININKAHTEVSLTTNELIKQLNKDGERQQLDQYIEKAIEIKGTLFKITQKHNTYSLLLKGNTSDTLVLCEMEQDQNFLIPKLEIGEEIVVKGVLKGFLMDAILLNCIVLEKETNE